MGVKAERRLARLAKLFCRDCCCPGMPAAARASVSVGITATGRVGFAASEDILIPKIGTYGTLVQGMGKIPIGTPSKPWNSSRDADVYS